MNPDSPIILPQSGVRNVLVTSALPYVNNVPHLGNIIGSVLSADVFARYCRGRGINTLYVGGTDEYGTSTETRAQKENCSPRELCDKFHAVHAQVYKWFNISFDVFGRTKTQRHTDITHHIFHKLEKHEFLEERPTTQPYCNTHGSFLADRLIEGQCPLCGFPDARGDQCDGCSQLLEPINLVGPRCKLDGSIPVTKETRHVVFKLDKLQPQVESMLHNVEKRWPTNARSATATWLKQGLKPFTITRDIRWGVPVPGYDKVFYSWFDACIGYVSITAGYTDQWETWWRNPDVQLYQFIGKDNVVFHSVVFPATQIGTGDVWTKVHHLSTTDFLTYEGGKFSKSRGVGVFGDSVQQTDVPPDVWRFYLLSCRPETGDTEFRWDGLIDVNNNLLLHDVGGFVSRALRLVVDEYSSIVPSWSEDSGFVKITNDLLARYIKEMDGVELRAGLFTALEISRCGDTLLSGDLYTRERASVVGLTVNLVHLLASLLAPYMPDTAAAINTQLQAAPLPLPTCWCADSIKTGHRVAASGNLFSWIDPSRAEEWRKAFGGEEGMSR
ncbi:tRNA synthetases class I (M)-domain-containing protein [Chaetomium tenue]|uniref:tRNA synthetases class I (M)-domain-containing protein n=1 Tax=Chaetomium tenue TaxID=1854479 RepID=A0ACB7PJ48_9PEZI|nr:tRNA synthetases class I (M)-domain-containing protein [Chaetomium globosum]